VQALTGMAMQLFRRNQTASWSDYHSFIPLNKFDLITKLNCMFYILRNTLILLVLPVFVMAQRGPAPFKHQLVYNTVLAGTGLSHELGFGKQLAAKENWRIVARGSYVLPYEYQNIYFDLNIFGSGLAVPAYRLQHARLFFSFESKIGKNNKTKAFFVRLAPGIQYSSGTPTRTEERFYQALNPGLEGGIGFEFPFHKKSRTGLRFEFSGLLQPMRNHSMQKTESGSNWERLRNRNAIQTGIALIF